MELVAWVTLAQSKENFEVLFVHLNGYLDKGGGRVELFLPNASL